jgi:DNA-binding LacI/PurR family transcriptional regulator
VPVRPHLAKRVLKVIEEMGYIPSIQARALVSCRSRIVGLIVSEITNPFFPEIVHVFEEMAIGHNYEILVTSTVHDTERMKIVVRRMLESRVEGVAVMTFGMEGIAARRSATSRSAAGVCGCRSASSAGEQYSNRLPYRYPPGRSASGRPPA